MGSPSREQLSLMEQEAESSPSNDEFSGDESEDGGVQLDQGEIAEDVVPRQPQPGMREIGRSLYFQDLTNLLNPGPVLWQPPPINIEDPRNQGSTKAPWFHERGEDPASRVWNKACEVLRTGTAWKCEPTEALPSKFCKSTPYSLALLFKLRSLAGRAKKARKWADDLLLQQWEQRMKALDVDNSTEARVWIKTVVHRDFGRAPNPLQFCESHIVENLYGLCLEDVIEVDRVLRDQKRVAKKAKKDGTVPKEMTYRRACQKLQDELPSDEEAKDEIGEVGRPSLVPLMIIDQEALDRMAADQKMNAMGEAGQRSKTLRSYFYASSSKEQ